MEEFYLIKRQTLADIVTATKQKIDPEDWPSLSIQVKDVAEKIRQISSSYASSFEQVSVDDDDELLIRGETLEEIARAIREMTGLTEVISPVEMPYQICAIVNPDEPDPEPDEPDPEPEIVDASNVEVSWLHLSTTWADLHNGSAIAYIDAYDFSNDYTSRLAPSTVSIPIFEPSYTGPASFEDTCVCNLQSSLINKYEKYSNDMYEYVWAKGDRVFIENGCFNFTVGYPDNGVFKEWVNWVEEEVYVFCQTSGALKLRKIVNE